MNPKELIELLADGEFHSGESLGCALGISRAGVWKRLQQLSEYGVELESVKGRGYRISGGLSLLSEQKIKSAMSKSSLQYLSDIFCFDSIDSTNAYLLQRQNKKGDICVAERQSSGRGRRGRAWYSPYGKNLYLSVGWCFSQGVGALEGLSLAVGVLLVDTLAELGVSGVQLKWPNDLLVAGAKLGGILIEVGGDLTGECTVVIGVGLNVAMSDVLPSGDDKKISQPWVDLKSLGYSGDKGWLCGCFLSRLLPALSDYPVDGFKSYKNRWEGLNAHKGQAVELHQHESVVAGVMLGVDAQGALLLSTNDCVESFNGGEVSLRASCDR